jgi:hypothetical protein
MVIQTILDSSITSALPCFLILRRQPARFASSFSSKRSLGLPCVGVYAKENRRASGHSFPSSTNSLPLNLFADPHPLTPVASIFYKKGGGQGCPPMRDPSVTGARYFTQVVSFQTLPDSFALLKNSSPFFSSDSKLFRQNTRGGGCLDLSISLPPYLVSSADGKRVGRV